MKALVLAAGYGEPPRANREAVHGAALCDTCKTELTGGQARLAAAA